MTKYNILSNEELQTALQKLSNWSYDKNNIVANYEFDDFNTAIKFIIKSAIKIEEYNHHPEIYNNYNKVQFSFSTHNVGNKITGADIKMAEIINKLASKFNAK